jgi:hypothetical protein
MIHFTTPLAGERTATVTTNRPTYTATVETGKTWVTTEINGTSLKIKVTDSEDPAGREAKITVHVDGAEDVEVHVTQAEYNGPLPIPALTAQWNVAAPGNIEWYKGTDRTIGTATTDVPPTVDAPAGLKAWALTKNDHIKVTNPVTAPTSTFSLLWDVRAASLSGYCSLLQTKEDNSNDGDIFFNGKKIGTTGAYSSAEVLTENTWLRIIIAVDGTEQKVQFYVDGQLAVTKNFAGDTGFADRVTLKEFFWLFLDEDGEINPLDCAGIAFWNVALKPGEVLSLATVGSPLQ